MSEEATVEIEAKPPDNPMVNEHRIGRFEMDDHLLVICSQDDLMNFMANFVVLRCEHNFLTRRFEYIAFSPLFEPSTPGKIAPFYTIEINEDGWHSAIKQ